MTSREVKCANPSCKENFEIRTEDYIERECNESHDYLIPCPYCSRDVKVTLKGKPKRFKVTRE
jgi:hypothetical protein